jgi:cob(I)alamin adenosyltransferase
MSDEVKANEVASGEAQADEARTFAGYASQEEKAAAKKPPPGSRKRKKGLVIVNTGPGKGKSTAAFGLVLRAWGRGMRVCIIQFIKHANAHFGEHRAAKKLGIEMLAMGDGFTWIAGDLDESAARGRHGWALAQEKIVSGDYDLIVLDEFTYALKYGWLDVREVVEWLAAHKPPMLHLVITGRDAPQELIDHADLVSRIEAVKHPLREQGIRGQAGIEY